MVECYELEKIEYEYVEEVSDELEEEVEELSEGFDEELEIEELEVNVIDEEVLFEVEEDLGDVELVEEFMVIELVDEGVLEVEVFVVDEVEMLVVLI